MVTAGQRHLAPLAAGWPARMGCKGGRTPFPCATANHAVPDTATEAARPGCTTGAQAQGLGAGRAKARPAAFAPAKRPASGIRPGIMSLCDTAGAGRANDALAASGSSTAVRRKERKDKTCHSVAVTPAADAAGCVGPMKKTKGPDFSGLCFVSR